MWTSIDGRRDGGITWGHRGTSDGPDSRIHYWWVCVDGVESQYSTIRERDAALAALGITDM